jgi:hypothetical protein
MINITFRNIIIYKEYFGYIAIIMLLNLLKYSTIDKNMNYYDTILFISALVPFLHSLYKIRMDKTIMYTKNNTAR